MRYIEQFREGMRVSDSYLCKTKQHAVTKTEKMHASVLLQDKTGTVRLQNLGFKFSGHQ